MECPCEKENIGCEEVCDNQKVSETVVTADYVPSKLYWHEALDRSSLACDFFNENVKRHPAVMNDIGLRMEAERITTLMAAFYQKIGCKSYEFDCLEFVPAYYKETNMQTKEIIRRLHLMADTIEDLKITNILSCNIDSALNMSVHLNKLILSGVEATWTERINSKFRWEKSYIDNNITFYAIYTEEEYKQEISE